MFRVAAVYLVAAWLRSRCADTPFEPMGLPAWAFKLVIVLAVLGFPLACALAWAFDVTPRGIERTRPGPARRCADGAEPQRLPASAGRFAAEPPVGRHPAVRRHEPGRDQEYFCDGIAEEIINALCCVRGLRVASRTSSFQFKGRAVDVREIGRSLGVGAVLEGSVRKSGERVRITAQLVSADGYHLWSESFDRGLEDVFATQTEIAQKLVRRAALVASPAGASS